MCFTGMGSSHTPRGREHANVDSPPRAPVSAPQVTSLAGLKRGSASGFIETLPPTSPLERAEGRVRAPLSHNSATAMSKEGSRSRSGSINLGRAPAMPEGSGYIDLGMRPESAGPVHVVSGGGNKGQAQQPQSMSAEKRAQLERHRALAAQVEYDQPSPTANVRAIPTDMAWANMSSNGENEEAQRDEGTQGMAHSPWPAKGPLLSQTSYVPNGNQNAAQSYDSSSAPENSALTQLLQQAQQAGMHEQAPAHGNTMDSTVTPQQSHMSHEHSSPHRPDSFTRDKSHTAQTSSSPSQSSSSSPSLPKSIQDYANLATPQQRGQATYVFSSVTSHEPRTNSAGARSKVPTTTAGAYSIAADQEQEQEQASIAHTTPVSLSQSPNTKTELKPTPLPTTTHFESTYAAPAAASGLQQRREVVAATQHNDTVAHMQAQRRDSPALPVIHEREPQSPAGTATRPELALQTRFNNTATGTATTTTTTYVNGSHTSTTTNNSNHTTASNNISHSTTASNNISHSTTASGGTTEQPTSPPGSAARVLATTAATSTSILSKSSSTYLHDASYPLLPSHYAHHNSSNGTMLPSKYAEKHALESAAAASAAVAAAELRAAALLSSSSSASSSSHTQAITAPASDRAVLLPSQYLERSVQHQQQQQQQQQLQSQTQTLTSTIELRTIRAVVPLPDSPLASSSTHTIPAHTHTQQQAHAPVNGASTTASSSSNNNNSLSNTFGHTPATAIVAPQTQTQTPSQSENPTATNGSAPQVAGVATPSPATVPSSSASPGSGSVITANISPGSTDSGGRKPESDAHAAHVIHSLQADIARMQAENYRLRQTLNEKGAEELVCMRMRLCVYVLCVCVRVVCVCVQASIYTSCMNASLCVHALAYAHTIHICMHAYIHKYIHTEAKKR
jgi:hypothetical protein